MALAARGAFWVLASVWLAESVPAFAAETAPSVAEASFSLRSSAKTCSAASRDDSAGAFWLSPGSSRLALTRAEVFWMSIGPAWPSAAGAASWGLERVRETGAFWMAAGAVWSMAAAWGMAETGRPMTGAAKERSWTWGTLSAAPGPERLVIGVKEPVCREVGPPIFIWPSVPAGPNWTGTAVCTCWITTSLAAAKPGKPNEREEYNQNCKY